MILWIQNSKHLEFPNVLSSIWVHRKQAFPTKNHFLEGVTELLNFPSACAYPQKLSSCDMCTRSSQLRKLGTGQCLGTYSPEQCKCYLDGNWHNTVEQRTSGTRKWEGSLASIERETRAPGSWWWKDRLPPAMPSMAQGQREKRCNMLSIRQ